MKNIRTFTVLPVLPDQLQALSTIATNLWWTWHPDAVDLFKRIDPELWQEHEHNPVSLLRKVSQERLEELSRDRAYLAHMERISRALQEYMTAETWFTKEHQEQQGTTIAYFSAEFGIHECLPIYSGGLGVLAGDHVKSASDLGLPLVGMGLFYRYGYCRQYLNSDGWQQEIYQENHTDHLPVERVYDGEGKPIRVFVDLPKRQVHAQVWQVKVGRVTLYLMDTNVPENSREDRWITGQLYGGDEEMRVCQEIILGIGGIRALQQIGINPDTCHMNEGHSAFLALERIRHLINEKGISFQEAREAVVLGNVFTTHTPVPAGNDVFSPELLAPYFKDYVAKLGLSWEDFLRFGRIDQEDQDEDFCMTVLALRLAEHRNGVSKLHGAVSRDMWKEIWPGVPEDEVPIGAITNGIHGASWIDPELSGLLDRYLGTDWSDPPYNMSAFKHVESIPDAELWRTHEHARERLIGFVRQRLTMQLKRRGASNADLRMAAEALDPAALTIGFARRFAAYKRGSLIFRDIERIKQIMTKADQPVQFIFAGKAHPRNETGKGFIREIIHVARREDIRANVVFLEDYDTNVARHMVHGVDVWLNNPRRPLEASGTSGMKVAANGGLNLSILDGWWCEGYRSDLGWAIGNGEAYDDLEYQNQVESEAIYDLLEKEVVTEFYNRDRDGLPRAWIARMKGNLAINLPYFETGRMVAEYAQRFYFLGAKLWRGYTGADADKAKNLARWKDKVTRLWENISVESVRAETQDLLAVGNNLRVQATIKLGSLDPQDLAVEIFSGPVDAENQIISGTANSMSPCSGGPDGTAIFEGEIPCINSGTHGFSVRVLPANKELGKRLEPGLITWG